MKAPRARRVLVVIAVVVYIYCAEALGNTITVPGDFASIQDAIVAAQDGDLVLVDPGTYDENLNFLGKAITVRSSSGALVTVIRGNAAAATVTFEKGEGHDSVLEGFTVTSTGQFDEDGIACRASPTVRGNRITGIHSVGVACAVVSYGDAWIVNNEILGNTSAFATGGIQCGGTTLVEGNLIENNSTGFGTGGISCGDEAIVRDNDIVGNRAFDGSAGGIRCYGQVLIEGNRIIGNSHAEDTGAGIVCGRGTPRIASNWIYQNDDGITCWGTDTDVLIENNVIVGNTEDGAIYCDEARAVVINNTIYANHSLSEAGGISLSGNGTILVSDTILWGNTGLLGPEISILGEGSTLAISYSDVQGGISSIYEGIGSTLEWGAGMFDADPQFRDPGALDLAITRSSPCVDAGDPARRPTGLDHAGGPRLLDGDLDRSLAVDVGAFEFGHVRLEVIGDAVPGGTVTVVTSGTPLLVALLFIATEPGETLMPPYGPLFFNLSNIWSFHVYCLVPDTRDLQVPLGIPSGTQVVLQELALEVYSMAGNVSGAVELTIGS